MKSFYTIESSRRADIGRGRYRNPVVPGDRPDPTILRDGDDYYMTFSSFLSYPGAVIWHSRDLVAWEPVHAALRKPIGSVYALDLCKHGGRYYIYIPAVGPGGSKTYVIRADRIAGPWSEPADLGVDGYIDPGHIVGEDGRRYLFFNGIDYVQLSDDGLRAVGKPKHAHSPWRYPDEWVTELYAPEGPKLFRRGDYFYMVSAVGGTAGPATSHMVVVARSKSVHGPWEDCPFNPIVRTRSAAEKWWSKGHATVLEGSGGRWWMVYHAYENGFRTLGRQTLLEPVEWTRDGWFRAKADPAGRLRMPRTASVPRADAAGATESAGEASGYDLRWSFHVPAGTPPADASLLGDASRVALSEGAIRIAARGSSPADSGPFCLAAMDRSYEAEVSLELEGGARGGLALFYDERMYCGVAFTEDAIHCYHNGQEQPWIKEARPRGPVRARLENDEQVVTFRYSVSGGEWKRFPLRMEVSGMNHNTMGGFMSLKVALLSIGAGSVLYRDFRYRGREKARG